MEERLSFQVVVKTHRVLAIKKGKDKETLSLHKGISPPIGSSSFLSAALCCYTVFTLLYFNKYGTKRKYKRKRIVPTRKKHLR